MKPFGYGGKKPPMERAEFKRQAMKEPREPEYDSREYVPSEVDQEIEAMTPGPKSAKDRAREIVEKIEGKLGPADPVEAATMVAYIAAALREREEEIREDQAIIAALMRSETQWMDSCNQARRELAEAREECERLKCERNMGLANADVLIAQRDSLRKELAGAISGCEINGKLVDGLREAHTESILECASLRIDLDAARASIAVLSEALEEVNAHVPMVLRQAELDVVSRDSLETVAKESSAVLSSLPAETKAWLERHAKLENAARCAVKHLESMRNYSLVEGACFWLEEALDGRGLGER